MCHTCTYVMFYYAYYGRRQAATNSGIRDARVCVIDRVLCTCKPSINWNDMFTPLIAPSKCKYIVIRDPNPNQAEKFDVA